MSLAVIRALVRTALWLANATDEQASYTHLAAAWVALNPEDS